MAILLPQRVAVSLTHGPVSAHRARRCVERTATGRGALPFQRVEGQAPRGFAPADRAPVARPHEQPSVVPACGLVTPADDEPFARYLFLVDEQPARRISDLEDASLRGHDVRHALEVEDGAAGQTNLRTVLRDAHRQER